MTSTIEKELIKASSFKPPKGGYKDRQDHLAALARLSNKITDKEFDDLSNPAADWVSAAIKAINAKAEIEDFEDESANEAEEADGSGDEGTDESGADAATGADDADGVADDPVDDEAEAGEKPAKTKAPKPDKKSRSASQAKSVAKAEKAAPKVTKRNYSELTGEKDRFGVIIGTKTHDAVMLYEKGCTTAQLRKELDGRFYNILRILEEKGHRVERQPGGIFKLTHVDDLPKKVKK